MGLAAAIAVIGLAATGAAVWTGAAAGQHGTESATCSERQQLRVIADSSIARALVRLADEFDVEHAELCVDTAVEWEDAADTAARVVAAAGHGVAADVWIPDSTMWLERIATTASSLGQPAPVLEARPSIAASPVVFAAAPKHLAALSTESPPTWARVLDGEVHAVLPDPEVSAASLTGLVALRDRAPADDPRVLAGAMIDLGRAIPGSATAGLVAASTSSEPSVVVTSEALLAWYNLDDPVAPLEAVYPGDGRFSLDYPFVVLPVDASTAGDPTAGAPAPDDGAGDSAPDDGAGDSAGDPAEPDAARADLVDRFEEALRSANPALLEAGFRAPDGTGEIHIDGIGRSAPATTAVADSARQLETLRTWGLLTQRSRMLLAVDVSGSMAEPVTDDLRRIDIFQRAAGDALSNLSGKVRLGVWLFSSARNGDLDYEEVAPIEPLADEGHAQIVRGVVDSLPQRLGGATGLYDTTLAAVRRMRETYDPALENSVLLITDGRNEDEQGVSLEVMLAELAASADPERPVPVIAIGFGPDSDVAALQQIAAATGGTAYTASRPEDLGVVLVDALRQRSCAPDCG